MDISRKIRHVPASYTHCCLCQQLVHTTYPEATPYILCLTCSHRDMTPEFQKFLQLLQATRKAHIGDLQDTSFCASGNHSCCCGSCLLCQTDCVCDCTMSELFSRDIWSTTCPKCKTSCYCRRCVRCQTGVCPCC